VNPPTPDGRVRALYAAASFGLDVAAFVIQAVWLMCVVGLAAFVLAFIAGAYQALF
jgi:hypothetical protein